MDNSTISSEEKRIQLEIIHGRLSGWWNSLGEPGAEDKVINRPLTGFKSTLVEAEQLTGESFQLHLPNCEVLDGQEKCFTRDLKTSIGGLAEELRTRYVKSLVSVYLQQSTAAATAVYQTNSVTLNFQIEVNDVLEAKKADFTDPNSKERRFIDLVKAGLSSVTNTAALISLLMSTASQVGMTMEQLKNFFR
jgi:hypothetical protein